MLFENESALNKKGRDFSLPFMPAECCLISLSRFSICWLSWGKTSERYRVSSFRSLQSNKCA
jgi:hypothetical protein